MGSDDTPEDDEVSTRDRIESFVDAVADVPGVLASTRGIGDEAYATIDVDFDYGNRDEFGNGNVCVAPDADDPVGREAYDHDLRIVRVTPKPDDERVAYWFAPEGAYADVAVARYARSIVEEGDTIGYHPVGTDVEDDVRQVGHVKDVREFDVVVTLPDDPAIEERVPYDRIRAHSKPDGVDA